MDPAGIAGPPKVYPYNKTHNSFRNSHTRQNTHNIHQFSMPKIMRVQNKKVIKTNIVEDEREKAIRVANLIMNNADSVGVVDQILIETFSEYWLKRGATIQI